MDKNPETSTGFKSVIRSLKHRNFRLFFLGQSISLIGTWMQRIALSWLVYRLTNSPFLLGFVGFAGQIPTFLLAPFAGVLADRWNRHRFLILTQSLSMVQALVLAFLVLKETVQIWHIVSLSIFIGIINAFDIPVRQSFTVDMVEGREELANAIALNSSMVNGARLLGPSIAGILIAATDEGGCFLINGISYIPVIAALMAMRFSHGKIKPKNKRIMHELKEGFSYAFGFPPVRVILLLLALVSFMGMPYVTLMPVFAKDILHGGPHSMGFLMGASGIGALIGAIYLASKKTVLGLGRVIASTSAVFGLALVCFSFSHLLWLSLILMLFTGYGQMVQMAASNTILQTITDDDKRGRVMSFYTMAFMGMTPFGSIFSGSLADKIGAPATIFIGGIACLAGSALFILKLPALKKIIRPIYVKLGIIPEIALGIQSATETAFSQKDAGR